MLFDDDTEPRKQKQTLKKLDNLSLDELRDYIDGLKSEIARTEEEIARKEAHKAAMSSLFKSK